MSEKSAPQGTESVIEPEVISVPVGMPATENQSLPEVLRDQLIRLHRTNDPMKMFEEKAALLTKLRPQAINLTKPQDWIQMGTSMYLQATGAERLADLYGLVCDQPQIARENYQDGTYGYIVQMKVFSRVTERFGTFEGGRWSGEKFFLRTDDEDNPVPPNPIDVRKAAVTNCFVRAVSMIAGLRNLRPEDLSAAGIKSGTKVTYGKGKGGGAAQTVNADGEVCIPFGKRKGESITDIPDNSLEWYVKNAQKNLDSAEFKPGGDRHKYRAKEERFLADLKGEVHRRVEELKDPGDREGAQDG